MKNIRCLFWNICRKKTPFEDILGDISNNVDVLILAEAAFVSDILIEQKTGLSRIKSNRQSDHSNITPKLFSSQQGFTLSHLNTVITKRLITYVLKIPGIKEILFSAIHFPSKLHYKSATQEEIANSYAGWIKEVESVYGKRTVLVGDFNMNPFELGMIKPKTFNATLSREIAKNKLTRRFHYEQYDYFYNPMWNFMGDHASGIPKLPGSYFFETSTDVEATFWNVFDKVIVRPEIIDHLDVSSINIPTSLNGHYFTTPTFQINSTKYSDHLPLMFELIF